MPEFPWVPETHTPKLRGSQICRSPARRQQVSHRHQHGLSPAVGRASGWPASRAGGEAGFRSWGYRRGVRPRSRLGPNRRRVGDPWKRQLQRGRTRSTECRWFRSLARSSPWPGSFSWAWRFWRCSPSAPATWHCTASRRTAAAAGSQRCRPWPRLRRRCLRSGHQPLARLQPGHPLVKPLILLDIDGVLNPKRLRDMGSRVRR